MSPVVRVDVGSPLGEGSGGELTFGGLLESWSGRSGEPQEVSGGYPVLPRKSALLSRPKERTWDRWGTTGLTAPRK